ncbi:hypothetical protein CKA32_001423 [Geitlerinema sp. FC II]|nr:hypothetical protein CKA32_001423 [Geitlerinema sp. FC II]
MHTCVAEGFTIVSIPQRDFGEFQRIRRDEASPSRLSFNPSKGFW